jgi:FAD/FMN-containing dehydrogenase
MKAEESAVQGFCGSMEIDPQKVLFNWSKTNPLSKREQLWKPNSCEEMQRYMCAHSSSPIRALGSGLSFEPIHSIFQEDSSAVLIDLCNFSGPLAKANDTVTYQAGTPLDRIFSDLIALDRMLPASPGVIGIQTLGGALSTGTHGQGLMQSTLCDAVEAMTIMLANGEVVRVLRTDEHFGAFVMGLGVLGIVLNVTLRTIPNQIMCCTKFTTGYDSLLTVYEQLNQEHSFVKGWWFPSTGQVHIWLVDPANDLQKEAYVAGGCELLKLSEVCDSSMNTTVDATVIKIAHDTKDKTRKGKHLETVSRFKDATDQIGNVYQILCKGIPAPQINCEVAIPLARMNEALNALQHWQEANLGTLHYPFILRCTGPSQAWLSGAYDRSVCWISFLVYLAEDGSYVNGSMTQMRDLQRLLAQFGGVPHFGKHLAMDLYDFPSLLPRWHDFIELKQRVDPYSRFDNRWFKKLFKTLS